MIERDETGGAAGTGSPRRRIMVAIRGRRPRRWPSRVPAPLAGAAALLLGACGGDGSTRYVAGDPAASGAAAPVSGAAVGASDEPGESVDATTPIARAPIQAVTPGVPDTSVGAPDPGTMPVPGPGVAGTPPAQLQQFEDDPSRLEPLPEVAHVEVLASSGLQVVYTTEAQRALVEPGYVDAQWQHMQSCTGVVAPPPLVLLVEDEARPLTPEDDVVLDIDGLALASASTDAAGTTLQVLDVELAPTAPDRGFALRAITGRWLWQGASLPERDYPFACANDDPAP